MIASSYRWVIVAAGGLLGCIAIGAMFSLPVLLTPMTEATGWSRTGISTAMTIGFIAMALGSMAWGTVSDRFGPRMVVLTGSCLLTVAMVLASHAPHAAGIPARVRPSRRRRNLGDLRADDGDGDRMVRYAAKSCGLAGLRRHGHGADDDVADRGMAGVESTIGARHC